MSIRKAILYSPIVLLVPAFTPALAQESTGANADSSYGEIIVTARKRDETSIAVPVALTAVTGAELDRRGIVTMDALANTVPTLVVGENGSVGGGIVAIRGIGGADNNVFNESPVSFNIDGVQVARSLVRRVGEYDVQQIEVLKGRDCQDFRVWAGG